MQAIISNDNKNKQNNHTPPPPTNNIKNFLFIYIIYKSNAS